KPPFSERLQGVATKSCESLGLRRAQANQKLDLQTQSETQFFFRAGQMIDWTLFATHDLFATAKQACQRSAEGTLGREGGRDAIVAVLFSAATLEGFMSQAVQAAETWGHLHPKVKAFADFLGELDEREIGASIKTKYNMARRVLCGAPFDRGRNPFQAFDLLIDLRNLLTHLKPDRTSSERTKKLLARVNSAGLIPSTLLPVFDPNSHLRAHWVHYICNPVIAKWSCNAAAAMITAFWDGAAEGIVQEVFRVHANAAHYTPLEG